MTGSRESVVSDWETQSVENVRHAAWVGLWSNLALAAIKFAAGVLGHSAAVVADALHSVTDMVTDIALILGVRFWSAPADERHPHGHRRIETLITVGIGLILAAVGFALGWRAVIGILDGGASGPTPSGMALAAAVLSVIAKEWLYRWTVAVGRREKSQALVANAWHHRSDALSSLPAGAAVAVAMVMPGWAAVDDIGAVIVCHFILVAAWRIMQPALAQLVDEGAAADQRAEIESLALAVDGVRSAHALRTRFVGSDLAVDLHVEVDADLSVVEGYEISQAVRFQLIENGPQVADVLVQVEPYSNE